MDMTITEKILASSSQPICMQPIRPFMQERIGAGGLMKHIGKKGKFGKKK